MHRRDVHVFRLAFVHRGGGRDRRATLPALDHARVAGGGHRASAEIGVDEHVVLVDPAQPALGFGTEETVLDPLLVGQVELAGDVGIRAAARQRDQAAGVFRTQAVGAVPHPVLTFGLVQRVQVQHGFPQRLGLAVFHQRGAAPDAPLVLLVLPEVVVVVANLLDARNLGVRIQHLADAGLHLLELRALRQPSLGFGVLFLHPGQRLVAGDVFQPGVLVLRLVSSHGSTGQAGGKQPCNKAGGGDSRHFGSTRS
ncbi:hypothetical protein D3C71_1453780 [compost metagenome]